MTDEEFEYRYYFVGARVVDGVLKTRVAPGGPNRPPPNVTWACDCLAPQGPFTREEAHKKAWDWKAEHGGDGGQSS